MLEFSNEITFKVRGLSSLITGKEGGLTEINDHFITTIVGVVIGTSRGMLAANTKGTDWSKFPLPILNPQQIVQDLKSSK